jgi:Gpi18-like mannosyltransferase
MNRVLPPWNYLLFAIAAIGIVFFVYFVHHYPKHSYEPDLNLFVSWAMCTQKNGVGVVYQNNLCNCNYHPFLVYVLHLWATWFPTEVGYTNIGWLRWFVVLFDLLIVFLAIRFAEIKGRQLAILLFALTLANPAFWYNTFVWAQVDAIHTSLCMFSLYLIWRKNLTLSIGFWVLALFVKLQAIVLLPVLGLLWMSEWRQLRFSKTWLQLFGVFCCVLFFLSPFILAGRLSDLPKVAAGAVGFYQTITMNAYNIWFLIPERGALFESDLQPYIWGITHRAMGTAMFSLTTLWVLWPLWVKTWQRMKNSNQEISIDLALQTATALSIGFFYFNTQMHERYVVPALAFALALAWRQGGYSIVAMLCLSAAIWINQDLVLGIIWHPAPAFHPAIKFITSALFLGVWVYYVVGTRKGVR